MEGWRRRRERRKRENQQTDFLILIFKRKR